MRLSGLRRCAEDLRSPSAPIPYLGPLAPTTPIFSGTYAANLLSSFATPMLRLQRVEISGFKSFYEKVDLSFPGRVTAVVGPNGCGKSNICDAVAWALGEQSARVLRGEKMDDVIFNGSREEASARHGRGHRDARVRQRERATAEHGEASRGTAGLPRRRGRVLPERQAGPFQGRAGSPPRHRTSACAPTRSSSRVASTRSFRRSRRTAGGSSKRPRESRSTRQEAETRRRRSSTRRRANLLRLSDIVNEVERNCASLKRQASRAARYKEHTAALRVRQGAGLARVRGDALVEGLAAAETPPGRAAGRGIRRRPLSLGNAEAGSDHGAPRRRRRRIGRDQLREVLAALESAIARDDERLESNRRAATDLAARRSASEREGRDFSGEESRTAREISRS